MHCQCYSILLSTHELKRKKKRKRNKKKERERERVKTKNKTKKFDYLKKNLLVGFVNNPYEFQRTRFFFFFIIFFIFWHSCWQRHAWIMIQEQRLKILVLWIRSRDGLLVEVRRRIQMMYSQHSLVKHHSFNSIYEYSTQKINKKLNIRNLHFKLGCYYINNSSIGLVCQSYV